MAIHSGAPAPYTCSIASYVDDLKRGETLVVEDARTDPRTQARAQAFETLSVRSFINLPLVEQGEVVAMAFVSHDAARSWLPGDVAFVRDAAERTRAANERRRAPPNR